MLALLAADNYLGFGGPDMTTVYLLAGSIVVVMVAMIFFRSLGKIKERRQLKRSSWKTFDKVAKVKGLSCLEVDILRSVIQGANVKRPSQVLGTITLLDKCVDNAFDRGGLSDAEQAILERVRNKIVTATVAWDGRKNRREFERTACGFDIEIRAVTKESLDEELKSSYEQGDEKFMQAFDGIAAEVPPMSTRVIDLSAGGMALLTQDKGIVKEDDF